MLVQVLADYGVVRRLHNLGEVTTRDIERRLGHVFTRSHWEAD